MSYHYQRTIEKLAEKHGVLCFRFRIEDSPYKRLSFEMEALPVLPFFADVALALNVKLEDIRVDHAHGGEGCETCGHGSDCEFNAEVKLS